MNKHEILKRYCGYDAFRTGQEALVDALLCGRDVLANAWDLTPVDVDRICRIILV